MCADSVHAKTGFPYQDATLPLEQRVADLISRMTWDEKSAQLGSFLADMDYFATWQGMTSAQRIARVQALLMADIVGEGIGEISCTVRELPPRAAAEKTNEIQRYAREHTRLGIPPIIHDEGLHGLIGNDATSFPQSIAMASSWRPELLHEIAKAIGTEARAGHPPIAQPDYQHCP